MKYLIMLATLLALPASGAELLIDFEWPTTRVDGSPQPTEGTGKLTSARFEYGTCVDLNGDEFGVKEGEVTVPYPETSKTVMVTAGIKCVRGYAMDDNNEESGPSNLGRYLPKPGTLSIKSTTRTAYEMREQTTTNTYVFTPVGTVPLARRCGAKLVDGYATIDGARITKPLRGGVIAAKCS